MMPPQVVTGGGARFHHWVTVPSPGDTDILEVAVTQAPAQGEPWEGGGLGEAPLSFSGGEGDFCEQEAGDSRGLSGVSAAEGAG